jgi:hypothetical protein
MKRLTKKQKELIAKKLSKAPLVAGRIYRMPKLRKLLGGETVLLKNKKYDKKFIVCNTGHYTDGVHTFYKVMRGQIRKYVRSDRMIRV